MLSGRPGARNGCGSRQWPAPLQPSGGGAHPAKALGLSSLDGLGLPEHPLALQALGGLLRYLQDTQPLRRTAAFPLRCRQSCTAAMPWY